MSWWWRLILVGLAILVVGCMRAGFSDFKKRSPDGAPTETSQDLGSGQYDAYVIADSMPTFGSWSEYASSLDVPACTGSLTLEVDTTTTELDGGEALDDPKQAGPTLSLIEALQIASNRSERVAIFFSESVFPAQSPGTIPISPGCTLPKLEKMCIDGRSRGVILDFQSGLGSKSPSCTLNLGQDVLVVGLELRRLQWQVGVTNGGQLAGCRVNSDGQQATIASEPETVTGTTGAIIGPGNSFGNTYGVAVKYAGLPTIRDNYFGLDPVTGAEIFNQFGVRLSSLSAATGTLRISGNVFRSWTGFKILMGTNDESKIVVDDNLFTSGAVTPAVGRWTGIEATMGFQGALTIGPDNRFVGLETAIRLDTTHSGATLTRNSITSCDEAMVIDNPKVEPPTITKATATFVEGTCTDSGTIEVFGDPGEQAATYLGATTCSSGTWRYDGSITTPNVTATVTTPGGGTSELSIAMGTH